MKLIAVCSGKGGTGKSCVSAYTAMALASLNKKVLLIDAGMSLGSLDVILGLQDTAVFNLHDVLGCLCEPQKAVLPAPRHSNLFLLPSGLPPSKVAGEIGFTELLRRLRSDYDFIIVDISDFVGFDFKTAHAVLMVTTPDTLSVRAAAQRTRELYTVGAKNIRLVINNVPARVIPMRSFADFDEVIDLIGAQLIAVIPESGKLHYSANNGLVLPKESLPMEVFGRLAERIRGKQEPLLIR